MMRLFLILIVGGLMETARSFAPEPGLGSGASGTALACGYLLITAFFAGEIFHHLHLPKLTGYLVTGIVVGPQLLGFVSNPMLDNLEIFNGTAIALIALTAGVELDLRSMRPLFRTITWLMVVAVLGTAALLAIAVYFTRNMLPFMHGLPTTQAIAVAAVLGITMSAQSPAVVVALRSEMRADGPLTRTVLGVVVMSDFVVILLFAIASTITKILFGVRADVVQTASALAWEILGSIAIGLLAGFAIGVYLRYAKGSVALFVVIVALVIAEVGQQISLDPLIIALAAGMLIRNATQSGERLYREVEGASLPVYVVFFAVTGATIHLKELSTVAVPAVLYVSVRAAGFLSGSWIATTAAGAPATLRKFTGLGLLPQAGLALALALLFIRAFPAFGAAASALVFGAVAINEMLAPALYRQALERSGEAGQEQSRVAEAESAEGTVES
ncbi:MAG TPA: cation:proton antiporter [Bryobacteraceae bacterium]|nr:cation:proton antiporter [Bryobacteraceae bacterium]